MTWATAADVLTVTGETVTDAQVAIAQDVVELFAGTTEDATDAGNVSERNLRLLTKAVAYQAPFVAGHPDIFTGQDVDSVSQDGLSVQYAHADARLLAPLAKRCIDRLSWKQRAIRVGLPTRSGVDYGNRDSAAHDDGVPWSPM